jgi:hemerythrin-like metal-binding protein
VPDFSWHSEYEIGIPGIDRQHRGLFDAAAELRQAMQTGRGSDRTGKLLEELFQYTINHFRTEEALMAAFDYPELHAHRQLHGQLRARLEQFQRRYSGGNPAIAVEFLDFLHDWLLHHIGGVDQRLRDWIVRCAQNIVTQARRRPACGAEPGVVPDFSPQ